MELSNVEMVVAGLMGGWCEGREASVHTNVGGALGHSEWQQGPPLHYVWRPA